MKSYLQCNFLFHWYLCKHNCHKQKYQHNYNQKNLHLTELAQNCIPLHRNRKLTAGKCAFIANHNYSFFFLKNPILFQTHLFCTRFSGFFGIHPCDNYFIFIINQSLVHIFIINRVYVLIIKSSLFYV